jgi:hypothetical protein
MVLERLCDSGVQTAGAVTSFPQDEAATAAASTLKTTRARRTSTDGRQMVVAGLLPRGWPHAPPRPFHFVDRRPRRPESRRHQRSLARQYLAGEDPMANASAGAKAG